MLVRLVDHGAELGFVHLAQESDSYQHQLPRRLNGPTHTDNQDVRIDHQSVRRLPPDLYASYENPQERFGPSLGLDRSPHSLCDANITLARDSLNSRISCSPPFAQIVTHRRQQEL